MTNRDKLTTKHRKIRRDVGFTVNHVEDGFEGLKVGDRVMFESLEELNKYVNTSDAFKEVDELPKDFDYEVTKKGGSKL